MCMVYTHNLDPRFSSQILHVLQLLVARKPACMDMQCMICGHQFSRLYVVNHHVTFICVLHS